MYFYLLTDILSNNPCLFTFIYYLCFCFSVQVIWKIYPPQPRPVVRKHNIQKQRRFNTSFFPASSLALWEYYNAPWKQRQRRYCELGGCYSFTCYVVICSMFKSTCSIFDSVSYIIWKEDKGNTVSSINFLVPRVGGIKMAPASLSFSNICQEKVLFS